MDVQVKIDELIKQFPGEFDVLNDFQYEAVDSEVTPIICLDHTTDPFTVKYCEEGMRDEIWPGSLAFVAMIATSGIFEEVEAAAGPYRQGLAMAFQIFAMHKITEMGLEQPEEANLDKDGKYKGMSVEDIFSKVIDQIEFAEETLEVVTDTEEQV